MRKVAWRTVMLAGLASVSLTIAGCAGGPYPFTQEWYAERASDPPGTRQIDSHGKLWPPQPRPVGRKQTKLHGYHYAHYWPYPQICEDEAYVRNIIDLQAGSGWVTATTLHDYHFNPETQQLTDGGRTHLLWISQSVPVQYRTVYVSQGISRETSQLRVEASEEFYREMNIPDPPAILAKAEIFGGRPAVEVDRIRQLEIQSIPKPRLFYIGSATAGGAAGGGIAGGGGVGAPGATGNGTGGAGSTNTR